MTLCRRVATLNARTIAGVGITARVIEACCHLDGDATRCATYHATARMPFAVCAIVKGAVS